MKIFVPLSVLAFAVLVPVNMTGRYLEHRKDLIYSDLDKLSISNTPPGSQRFEIWTCVHISLYHIHPLYKPVCMCLLYISLCACIHLFLCILCVNVSNLKHCHIKGGHIIIVFVIQNVFLCQCIRKGNHSNHQETCTLSLIKNKFYAWKRILFLCFHLWLSWLIVDNRSNACMFSL